MCIGFLPHNFYPARIFMGDIGAMLLGLLLAYGPISSTDSLDPALLIAYSDNHPLDRFPTFLPLLVPAAIFVIPYADLMFAVIRRAKAGKPLMAADRQHLHHRLLNIGHSYRQSVLLMYLWAALFSVTVVSLSLVRTPSVVFFAATLVAVLALLPATMPRLRPWRARYPGQAPARRQAFRAGTPRPRGPRPGTPAYAPAARHPCAAAPPARRRPRPYHLPTPPRPPSPTCRASSPPPRPTAPTAPAATAATPPGTGGFAGPGLTSGARPAHLPAARRAARHQEQEPVPGPGPLRPDAACRALGSRSPASHPRRRASRIRRTGLWMAVTRFPRSSTRTRGPGSWPHYLLFNFFWRSRTRTLSPGPTPNVPKICPIMRRFCRPVRGVRARIGSGSGLSKPGPAGSRTPSWS